MRPSRRRVTAVALLLFGLALAPLSARPSQRTRHVSPAASPVAALWHELLSLLGLEGRQPSGSVGTDLASPGISTSSDTATLSADDGRSGLDPNG